MLNDCTPEVADRTSALRTLSSETAAVKMRALEPAANVAQTVLAALQKTQGAPAAHYQALSLTLANAKAKLNNPAPASPDTFVVHGTIVDELGAPRSDCSLVVADAGNVVSSKVGPQQANADGYATVVLRAAEFPTIVDGSVPVFVSVRDGAGRQVFAPSTPVSAKSGAVAVFRAVVPRVQTDGTKPEYQQPERDVKDRKNPKKP